MDSESAKETPAGGTGNQPRPARNSQSRGEPTEAECRRIAELRRRSQAARRMARQLKKKDKETFAALNELLLASRLHDVLQELDPAVIRTLIDDKPEQFFRLASAVNAQAAERLRREKVEFEFKKYKNHVTGQKHQLEQAAHQAAHQGLTPDILAQIENATRLL